MHAMWWIWFPLLMFFLFGPLRRRRYWRYRYERDFAGSPAPSPAETARRDEEIRRREEQIESLETRVAELESRLDFTERLLAQRRELPPLGNATA